MLASKGMAPSIKNLVGQLQFTDAEIHATRRGLDAAGVSLPSFGNVGTALARELNGPDRAAKASISRVVEEPEPEPETLLSNEELRNLFWANNTASIVRCQEIWRGALERKRFLERRNLQMEMEEFFILVQAQGRGELVRRRFRNRMRELYAFEPQAVTVS